jgi:hypothetical protein
MKDKQGPYHFDDIMKMMLDIFPEMELGEDNDGQLIVYTGFEGVSSDGYYAPMKLPDYDGDFDCSGKWEV